MRQPLRVRRIEGQQVAIRRFRLTDEPAVWAGLVAADPAASPRPPQRHPLRDRLSRSGEFDGGSLNLGIETDGRLIGDVQVREGAGQRLPPGVVELGIQLYHGDQRGKGYGTEAIRLLTAWIFENEVAERVQASTTTGNLAMRRVLEKAGFTFEGVMRGFMPVGDHREDFALYAVTKDEWRRQPRPADR